MSTQHQSTTGLSVETLECRQVLAAAPHFIGDLNNELVDAEFAWLGDELFFAANDGSGDVELWKSDGTPQGTTRVADIRPGELGSYPQELTAADGRVLFTAYNEETGRELWSTDGTEGGTILVRDFAAGPASSSVRSLAEMQGMVQFEVDEELWISDGTQEHTMLADQIEPVIDAEPIHVDDQVYYITESDMGHTLLLATDSDPEEIGTFESRPHSLIHFGDSLYFTVHSGDKDRLMVSDGTPAGTHPIELSSNREEYILEIIATDSQLFVFAERFTNTPSTTLWGVDSETQTASPLRTLPTFDWPYDFVTFNDQLYFLTERGLWQSNGTREGTLQTHQHSRLSDLQVMGDSLVHVARQSDRLYQLWQTDGTRDGRQILIRNLVNDRVQQVEGTLYVTVANQDDVQELWRSDGTVEGSYRLLESPDSTSYIGSTRQIDGTLYVTIQKQDDIQELWRTNGTVEGTYRVLEVPGNSSIIAGRDGIRYIWTQASNEDSGLWVVSDDDTEVRQLNSSITGPTRGDGYNILDRDGNTFIRISDQTWQTDGQTAWEVDSEFSDHSEELPGKELGEYRYYADQYRNYRYLWRTDGTEAGTEVFSAANGQFAFPDNLTVVDGSLYFSTYHTGTRSNDIWKIDGATGEASQVTDFQTRLSNVERGISFWELNGALFYSSPLPDTRGELWRIDPATGETGLLQAQPSGSVRIEGIYGGEFYFTVTSEDSTELWKSDGTELGTVPLSDLGVNSGLGTFLEFNGQTIFTVYGEHTPQLWSSDGTAAGTVMLTDAYGSGRTGQSLVVAGDQLFFVGNTEETGDELWVSDGTPEGTRLVEDIVVGGFGGCGGGTRFATLVHDDTLYFTSEDESGERSLWRSDGTEVGTYVLSGLHGDAMTVVDDTIYYYNSDEIAGTELWKTDGTVAGSVRLTDINPGPADSFTSKYPDAATASNGYLYFIADDGFHGQEVWSLSLDAEPAELPGDYDGDGQIGQGDLDLVLFHWGQVGSEVGETWLENRPEGMIDQQELDNVLLYWGQTVAGGESEVQPAGPMQPVLAANENNRFDLWTGVALGLAEEDTLGASV